MTLNSQITDTPGDPGLEPADLSPESLRLYRGLIEKGYAKSEPRREAIRQALLCKDRATSARQIIEREGLLVLSKRSGMARAHPAAAIESENRRTFLAAWKRLRLESVREDWGR